MAKKRLNMKIVIILTVVGMTTIALGAFVAYKKWWPKDPAVFEQKGDEFLAKKDYGRAQKNYGYAVYHTEKGTADFSRRTLILVETLFDWTRFDPSLGDSDRSEQQRRAKKLLEDLLTSDPGNIAARKRLCQIWWEYLIVSTIRGGSKGSFDPALSTEYIKEAEILLNSDDLEDKEIHETWFRLATVFSDKAKTKKNIYDKKALHAYGKALELDKDNPRYTKGLAFHHGNMRRTLDGQKLLVKAMAANPKSADMILIYTQYLRSIATMHPDRCDRSEILSIDEYHVS